MVGRLKDRVAIVVGAGSSGPGWGNGKCTALTFAREGARVMCVDAKRAAAEETVGLITKEGGEAVAFEADASSNAGVKAMVDACLGKWGRIDVLDNNVGIGSTGGPVELAEDEWDRVFEVNVKSFFLTAKHVLPVMEKQAKGAIVNLSSVAGFSHQVGGRVHIGYSTAKSGMIGFTRSIAIAYVKKGIRCNLVVPGTMHTPLVEQRLMKQLGPKEAAELVAKRHAAVPIGQMGDAWDIAHAVLFLASDEARHITATHLIVDGGLTAARPG